MNIYPIVKKSVKKIIKKVVLYLLYYSSSEYIEMDPEFAMETLRDSSPMPQTTAIMKNRLGPAEVDLSVIIPAYNAQLWIKECIESVVNQKTKYSFDVIIIDDGSTDDTGVIVDNYKAFNNVSIIHQENKGYSGARNRGLKNLHCKYLMFVDADDYLLPGAIDCLLEEAILKNADVVEGNGFRFDNNGRIGKIKTDSSTLSGYPWMKIIKSDLFANIGFPEGMLYEDKIIGSLIYKCANSKNTIDKEIYAYRVHENSITQRHDSNPKRIDSFWMMLLMRQNQEELGFSVDHNDYVKSMRQIRMTYKRTVLLDDTIKKALFIASKQFIMCNYQDFINCKDQCKWLSKALQKNDYKKYCIACERVSI